MARPAERNAVALGLGEASFVVPFLNRLSDLCWLLARTCEDEYMASRTGEVRAGRAKE